MAFGHVACDASELAVSLIPRDASELAVSDSSASFAYNLLRKLAKAAQLEL